MQPVLQPQMRVVSSSGYSNSQGGMSGNQQQQQQWAPPPSQAQTPQSQQSQHMYTTVPNSGTQSRGTGTPTSLVNTPLDYMSSSGGNGSVSSVNNGPAQQHYAQQAQYFQSQARGIPGTGSNSPAQQQQQQQQHQQLMQQQMHQSNYMYAPQ